MTNYSADMTQQPATEPALRLRLRDAVMSSGVTRGEVARRAGMSEGSLRRHIDGTGSLSVFALLSIAPAVGLDAYALLNEVGIH